MLLKNLKKKIKKQIESKINGEYYKEDFLWLADFVNYEIKS